MTTKIIKCPGFESLAGKVMTIFLCLSAENLKLSLKIKDDHFPLHIF